MRLTAPGARAGPVTEAIRATKVCRNLTLTNGGSRCSDSRIRQTGLGRVVRHREQQTFDRPSPPAASLSMRYACNILRPVAAHEMTLEPQRPECSRDRSFGTHPGVTAAALLSSAADGG